MCGIVGVFNANGEQVPAAVIERMSKAIAHRGPDGEGCYTDEGVGLGHRRLAVIDPSPAGRQPMVSPDGHFVITYNGEVYNFGELRRRLEEEGYRFHSNTDTEVVLYAYQEWGSKCVNEFDGMFAFAVLDRRTKTLFLARDRYGIKPLYYVQIGSVFLFASEVKAFLQHPAFRVEISPPQLLEYFTFQNIFTDGTLFKGVKLLQPGHFLTIQLSDARTTLTQYWDFEFRTAERECSGEEYENELDYLFRKGVERQLVSDVPIGSYLSGGMDSGSITAVAAERFPYLKTFTCGFDLTSAAGMELNYDERQKAEALSYLLKTEHYEVVLKAGDMERCLPYLVWHLEDLRVGQSYPNYYVARLASKFVKVVLGGTGGDELFAGYPWRYYRGVVNNDFNHYVQKYYTFWHRLVSNRDMAGIFTPNVWNEVRGLQTIDIFRSVLGGQDGEPRTPEEYVNRSLYFEAKTFLQGLLLVEDKLSMAHGLEARVPFLDNDIVDFATKLPAHLKLRDLENVVRLNENEPGPKTHRYFHQTNDGKLLLRQVMSRYVPDSVTNQIKQGFSAPDATWFRGDSMAYVQNVIFDEASPMYEFLQPKAVQALVKEHLAGQVNRRLFIWSLLCFDQWCRTFLAGERPEPATQA